MIESEREQEKREREREGGKGERNVYNFINLYILSAVNQLYSIQCMREVALFLLKFLTRFLFKQTPENPKSSYKMNKIKQKTN